MGKLTNHVKTLYYKYQFNLLKDQIDAYLNVIHALDELKDEAINQQLKDLKRKHERTLYQYELQTLSDQDYAFLNIKHYTIKRLHHYHLKVLRSNQLSKKQNTTNKHQIKEINHAFQQDIQHKMTQIIQKRDKKRMSIKDFEYEKNNLEKQFQINEIKIKSRFDLKFSQKKHTLNKRLHTLQVRRSNILEKLNKSEKQEVLKDNILLSVNQLSMHFGGLKAVDDLSFEVKKGEIFGLIGPNGAGKTTVFNCITQFYKVTGGDILFRNKENHIINLNQTPVHRVIKEGIARTFQNVELIYELSILDNLLVGGHSLFQSSFFKQLIHSPQMKREEKILKSKAIKILTDLGLYYYKDMYPIGLPYGMLKKIELARVLMTEPEMIILDEPAAGLNDKETQDLALTIKKIQKEYDATIFLVEHDMGLVMDICDTICAISFGKKLAVGTPKEIKANRTVQEAYLGGEQDA